MLSALTTRGNYINALIPLLVEGVLISGLVNLASDYLATKIQVDDTTIFIVLFLLIALIALYAQYQKQLNAPDDPASQQPSPTDLGGVLSVAFFSRFFLLDCADLAAFNRWYLIGLGSFPFLAGASMKAVLNDKYQAWLHQIMEGQKHREEKRKLEDQAREAEWTARLEAEKRARHEAEIRAEKLSSGGPSDGERDHAFRVSVRTALQRDLDVEQQPGVLFIVIESILAVKKTVSQWEIFEACKMVSKELPSTGLFELIRDLMAAFVNIRQKGRRVQLITEDPKDWKIIEANPS